MSLDLLAFLKWYLALLALGAVATPLAFKFFQHLPERGYALTKPLGGLVVYYVFWFLGSIGFLGNNLGGQVLAMVVVLVAGTMWLKRAGLDELRAWVVAHRRYILAVEIFFLVAFGLMAWVRAYNPDIVATEKPMELMFINSVLRSPAFPPQDAWLAGHAISYYYFGYVIVAALARLTAVPAAYAFNLGLAMLFALTAVGSLGVTLNLISLVKQEAGSRKPEEVAPSSLLLPSFWPALLGPLFVLLVGNFYGVLSIAHANGTLPELKIPAVWYEPGRDTGTGTRCAAAYPEADPGLRVGLVNVWTWFDIKGTNTPPPTAPAAFNWDPNFWWWFSGARVVHDCNLVGVETEAIDEVPAFSFILGDMHPHVLALPFVVLAVAVALQWLLGASGKWQVAGDVTTSNSFLPLVTRHLSLVPLDTLLLSAITLGGLAFLNTWDFPMYWFVTSAALFVGCGLRWGWAGLLTRWRELGLTVLALAVLSLMLYLPFFLVFQSQASGMLPNLIYPTRFQQTFVMFGPVLVGVALLVGWVAYQNRAVIDRESAWWAGGGLVLVLALFVGALAWGGSLNPELSTFVDRAIAPLTREQAIGLLWQRRLVDSLTTLFSALLIGLSVGLGVGFLKRLPSPNGGGAGGEGELPLLFTLILILTGALLLLGPEFVYLRDNFGSRMNTIFKFYFQVWVLWALASAFGGWYLWHRAGQRFRWVVGGLLGLAIAGGLVYTLAGIYSKADHFKNPPTLNGLAYFERSYPNDWAAIQWLQNNVAGSTVIAEGIGGQYWIEGRFSRFSMITGLPTVMGWPGHEGQWRGQYFANVAEREGRIRELYQTRDWNVAQAVLNDYQIEYVIVSDLERAKYQDPQSSQRLDQAKFDRFMLPVFQSGDVTIYQRADGK